MAELLEEQRETWDSRGGFVLAAIGSAVGLGNLWAFPYKLYDNGGGAFLIPYAIAMLTIGIPMLIMEFGLGHFTQRAAPDAFRACNKRIEFVGWWGILLGFVIVIYYPVILAYCFSFIYYSVISIVNDTPLPWAGEGAEGVRLAKDFFYKTYLNTPEQTEWANPGRIQLHILLPLVLTWFAMYLCIFKGVKLVGKIVWLTVPLPFFMLIVLGVRGLTLPGAMDGLVYYLDPDWSQLKEATTWRFAFGQVFFSLSLAFGVMVTYASFLHRKSDINNNAAIIGLSDLGTSFVGGIAIFATLGGMAYATQQAGSGVGVEDVVDGGPGLAFVAFPYALAQLPGAAWWSLIFFFTLATLGIDSGFSITESVLAGFVDKTGWKRAFVLPVMSLIGLAFGLIFITNSGLSWLGTMDGFINGTWGIAFLGLMECIALGWFYRIEKIRVHANERSDWKIGPWWNYLVRVFIPIVLGTLFVWNLYEDFSLKGGFLRSPDGEWILQNLVGMMVMIAVPVIAILLSRVKSHLPRYGKHGIQQSIKYKASHASRLFGITAFILACISVIVILCLFSPAGERLPKAKLWLYYSLLLGIISVLVGNVLMNKLDRNGVSVPAPASWAGIIGTLGISACIAKILIEYTATSVETGVSERMAHENLSLTSYIILGVFCVLVIGGLSWCFWRAISANAGEEEKQYPSDNE